MRMDEEQCYLDKLFFSVKYVGIYLAGLADREVIPPLQTVGEMFSVMC